MSVRNYHDPHTRARVVVKLLHHPARSIAVVCRGGVTVQSSLNRFL